MKGRSGRTCLRKREFFSLSEAVGTRGYVFGIQQLCWAFINFIFRKFYEVFYNSDPNNVYVRH